VDDGGWGLKEGRIDVKVTEKGVEKQGFRWFLEA
jgi:hypothetical protein